MRLRSRSTIRWTLRRQCAAGLFGRGDRRVFACVADRIADVWPSPSRCTPTSSTIAMRRPRSRCAQRRFRSVRAIRWSCATCSTSAARPPLNPAQQQLSEQMIDYWSRFVSTGPDGPADWPPLASATRASACRCSLTATASSPISNSRTNARSGQTERLTAMPTPDPTTYADEWEDLPGMPMTSRRSSTISTTTSCSPRLLRHGSCRRPGEWCGGKAALRRLLDDSVEDVAGLALRVLATGIRRRTRSASPATISTPSSSSAAAHPFRAPPRRSPAGPAPQPVT